MAERRLRAWLCTFCAIFLVVQAHNAAEKAQVIEQLWQELLSPAAADVLPLVQRYLGRLDALNLQPRVTAQQQAVASQLLQGHSSDHASVYSQHFRSVVSGMEVVRVSLVWVWFCLLLCALAGQ